jgi:hypothetical protein
VAERDAVGLHCPRCGAAMAPEQDWCLECGLAATTRVVPPPSWGIPVAIVLVVFALVGGALAFAIARLSNDADDTAAEHAATRTVPTSRPATTRTATGPGTTTAPHRTAALATWPPGTRAYSVIVFTSTSRAAAEARARRLAQAGTRAGVLRSADFKGLQPGFFLAFAGRYPDQTRAQSAAGRLAGGQRGYPTLVDPR